MARAATDDRCVSQRRFPRARAILEVKTRYPFWEADVFGEQGAELK
jgi:hypothetical protein